MLADKLRKLSKQEKKNLKPSFNRSTMEDIKKDFTDRMMKAAEQKQSYISVAFTRQAVESTMFKDFEKWLGEEGIHIRNSSTPAFITEHMISW